MDTVETLGKLVERRGNWNRQFQVLGKYVSQVKVEFEGEHEEGAFLNEDVFDSSGTFAAHNASSALLGMLWPSSAKNSIEIAPPVSLKDPTDEEIEWYEEFATPELAAEMDRPQGNLLLSLDEYMLDEHIFGTAGVGIFYEDDHLLYKSYSVKEAYIEEGKNGRVGACYLTYSWEAGRIVGDYGEDAVSDKVKEAHESGSKEKFDVVICYRETSDGGVETTHIEKKSKKELRKAKFEEFPIAFGRFRKLLTEVYGRSPAMNALPDIMEANILREAIILATEKLLDPALGVLNDSMLGGGVIDTSAGAINVFDGSGNQGNTPPVFPINTVGELNAAYTRLQDLQQSIAQHFSIDRLLDFNNETQMTATETRQRSSIRNNSLSSLLNRQIVEVFTPLVERSFNLMMRNNRFGYIQGDVEAQTLEQLGEEVKYIPERIGQLMLDGKDSYVVRFTTPADRIASASEQDGLLEAMQIMQGLAQTHPDAMAYLNVGGVAESITRLFGNPPSVINTEEEAQEIITAQQQAQQAAQEAEMMNSMANTAKTAVEAEQIAGQEANAS